MFTGQNFQNSVKFQNHGPKMRIIGLCLALLWNSMISKSNHTLMHVVKCNSRYLNHAFLHDSWQFIQAQLLQGSIFPHIHRKLYQRNKVQRTCSENPIKHTIAILPWLSVLLTKMKISRKTVTKENEIVTANSIYDTRLSHFLT